MKTNKPARKADALTKDEIESCFEGSSDVALVRDLLKDNQDSVGWIRTMNFGDEFAQAIEGFIGEEPNTEEWEEAWAMNCEWGRKIADNINDLLGKK